jgi:hypothetical protein
MATDLESLSKAEEELQDLQVKLRNSKLESLERSQQQQQQEQVEAVDVMEVSRLKEQVIMDASYFNSRSSNSCV